MPNEVNRTLSMGLEAYQTGLSLVGEFEKDNPGFSKALGTPLPVQYRAEMLSYLLFLSETAGGVNERAAEFIRKVLDYSYTKDEFNELMRRLDLHGQDFGGLIPTSLKAAWSFDEKRGMQKASESMIRVIDRIGEAFRLYSMTGSMMEEMDQRIYVLALTNWLAARNAGTGFGNLLPEELTDYGAEKNDSLPELPDGSSLILNEQGFSQSVRKEREKKESEEEIPKENLEDLMKELNDLTGLQTVKEDVNSLVNLLRIRQLRRERNMPDIDVSMHLVFTGNPGTGKTTVTRLLARIYHSLGALSKGQLIEVDRSELVSGYVGQTAIKTQEVTNSAKGGVLFIDEAYALTSGKDKSDFGYEAVNTLLVEMENNRDDLAVIVAGYPKPMEDFLQSNPGLKSRFNKFIEFPDYKPDELYDIFRMKAEKAGYSIPEETKKKAQEVFETIYAHRGQDFANGRTVRNFFEKAMVRQANRLAAKDEISDEMLAELLPEDLPAEEFENSQESSHQLSADPDSEQAAALLREHFRQAADASEELDGIMKDISGLSSPSVSKDQTLKASGPQVDDREKESENAG